MVDINVALLSILSPKALLTKRFSYFVDLAIEMGYKGFEIQPPRAIFPLGFQLKYNPRFGPMGGYIKSLHQSFRSERWPWQWMFHQRKRDALKAYLLFNHRLNSPKDLRQIMINLGQEVPVVLYPSHTGEKPVTEFAFQEMLVQPSQGLLQTNWIKNPLDFLDYLKFQGFHGIALDTAHTQGCERYLGVSMNFLVRSWLPKIHEIHVSLSRELGDDKMSLEIVRILHTHGFQGPYVVETAPNPNVDFHKKIVEDLQRILN